MLPSGSTCTAPGVTIVVASRSSTISGASEPDARVERAAL